MLSLRKVKSIFKKEGFEFELSTIKVNGDARGVSGFIRNPKNKLIVYINTEDNFRTGYLYRIARSLKDYYGGSNNYAKNSDDLYKGVMELLSDLKIHQRQFGAEFGVRPKIVVTDSQRQIPGSASFF